MAEVSGTVFQVAIEDEVRKSYLNYAMSVIVSRALPDARDGLKPVHRRILYAMGDMGLRSDRPFKKSGRIVGDVLGKYHPHGDASIYDALVRLAQVFSMRYPVVDGQGNFGSVDGDPPAASRYTEARLQKIGEEMLEDIRKETVDFKLNYDDSMEEPEVLPGKFPYLLTNGASGIAVGMATNIPPHNLREIANAVKAFIARPDITVDELMQLVPGPDFPTGGIVHGREGIREAYETGRGKIVVRGAARVETLRSGHDVIIVDEIPYQVNKAALIQRIAELVRERKVDGISDLRDESDRDGLRIVIELRRGETPKVVLNRLFAHTQLQVNFSVNALALVDGRPVTLSLRDMIEQFVIHRRIVVRRRAEYELRKAREREHVLEGLIIAIENIDEIVALIRSSASVDEARTRLIERYELSEIQAQAILDMRLQRLSQLEVRKLRDELASVRERIAELEALLASEEKISQVVVDETTEIAAKYGDERRTQIVAAEASVLDIEALVQREPMVLILSSTGLVKRVPLKAYRTQGRGGKGSSSASLRDGDAVDTVFVANTHDIVCMFSTEGHAFWMKTHEFPEGSRNSRGRQLRALISLSQDESVAATVVVPELSESRTVMFVTAKGTTKRTQLSEFGNAKTRGIVGLHLASGDRLVTAMAPEEEVDLVIATRKGMGLRLRQSDVRVMGRAARGVAGIRLTGGDEVAGAIPAAEGVQIIVITERGFGKRVAEADFVPHGRGTQGQRLYPVSEETGEVVGIVEVIEEDELLVITSKGTAVRIEVASVPVYGRAARGVRVMSLEAPDVIVSLSKANDDE